MASRSRYPPGAFQKDQLANILGLRVLLYGFKTIYKLDTWKIAYIINIIWNQFVWTLTDEFATRISFKGQESNFGCNPILSAVVTGWNAPLLGKLSCHSFKWQSVSRSSHSSHADSKQRNVRPRQRQALKIRFTFDKKTSSTSCLQFLNLFILWR